MYVSQLWVVLFKIPKLTPPGTAPDDIEILKPLSKGFPFEKKVLVLQIFYSFRGIETV